MRKSFVLIVLAASAMLWGVACGGGGSDCNTAPDFATCVAPILDKSCGTSGCHSGDTPSSNLNLKGIKASDIVGVDSKGANAGTNLVTASKPDESVLYLKLLDPGDRAKEVKGGKMPIGTPLAASDITIIKTWIANGAK